MSHAWSWQDRAACKGRDDLFFAADGEREAGKAVREEAAKAVCDRCPVRARCLTYALSTNERSGIWGGLSEDERASIRRQDQRHALKAARQPQESPAGQQEQLEEAV